LIKKEYLLFFNQYFLIIVKMQKHIDNYYSNSKTIENSRGLVKKIDFDILLIIGTYREFAEKTFRDTNIFCERSRR
jgi:hypothetical protein